MTNRSGPVSFGTLLGACSLAAALVAVAGCSRYDAALNPSDRSLVDRSQRTVDQRGFTLGETEEVDLDDAASSFAEGQVESVSEDGVETDIDPDAPLEPLELSLAEVRSSVVGGSLTLRKAEFAPRVASEGLEAERAKFDAIFVVDVDYKDEDKPLGNTTLFETSIPGDNVSKLPGSFTELPQDREKLEAEAGLDIPLPTGGTFKIRQGIETDDKRAGGLRSTEDRAASKFSISQPLLRGGGIAVNTASIRIAELAFGQTTAETRLTAVRLLAEAEKAYWKLYAAQKVAEVERDQLRLATENLTFTRQLIDEGLFAPVQRFGAELAVAQQLEKVVTAETEVRLRARDLSRMLNREDLPIDEPREILPQTEPTLARYKLERRELVERAMTERLDLIALELKLAAKAIEVDLARNATLPVFLVDFSYGLSDREGTVVTAVSESYGGENQAFGVGARLAVPVTNNVAEAKLRKAMLGRLQRLASVNERKLFVRQEVHDAADVLELSWQRVLASRQAVIAAGANYEAELGLFRDGLSSAQDVLIALRSLGSARASEVKAIVEYQVSQVDLAFATGTLLGYAGTELEPTTAG